MLQDDDQVRVYVAAGHTAATLAKEISYLLQKAGAEVVSLWTTRPIGWQEDAGSNVERAVADVAELDRANVFVGLYNEDSRSSHAEFGYALAKGLPCLVTSVPTRNVDHLPVDAPVDQATNYLDMLHWHPSARILPGPDAVVEAIKPLIRAKQITCDVCGRLMRKNTDQYLCWCGAIRERTSLVWREEAIIDHLQTGCMGIPRDGGDGTSIECGVCNREWRQNEAGGK